MDSMTKLTFRPRPGRKLPRYPTRRDFLRALGGAAIAGVLASQVGCDGERAVPHAPDGGHLHDAGVPDAPMALQGMEEDLPSVYQAVDLELKVAAWPGHGIPRLGHAGGVRRYGTELAATLGRVGAAKPQGAVLVDSWRTWPLAPLVR